MSKKRDAYEVAPFPRMRRFALDAGYLGRRRHIVHGLLELDVTVARQAIREHKARTGESLSFTAFIINCLAQAIDEHKAVHAYRNWRNQLVIFDDVNINTMVEVESGGRRIPIPHIIKAANKRTFRDIHDEIRVTQTSPHSSTESKFMRWFLFLPAFLRRLFYWFVMRMPRTFREYASAVLVTAVGMFGQGTAWGIPMPNSALTVTLGGIAEKPGVIDGRIEIREFLSMTVSFDHDIIDGAPAARFTQRLRELVESGYDLPGAGGAS
jgi:pyruvate/2-oxoglutarate dehydrogenase complex dihydrolipoamide acyltransferase (E2) component